MEQIRMVNRFFMTTFLFFFVYFLIVNFKLIRSFSEGTILISDEASHIINEANPETKSRAPLPQLKRSDNHPGFEDRILEIEIAEHHRELNELHRLKTMLQKASTSLQLLEVITTDVQKVSLENIVTALQDGDRFLALNHLESMIVQLQEQRDHLEKKLLRLKLSLNH